MKRLRSFLIGIVIGLIVVYLLSSCKPEEEIKSIPQTLPRQYQVILPLAMKNYRVPTIVAVEAETPADPNQYLWMGDILKVSCGAENTERYGMSYCTDKVKGFPDGTHIWLQLKQGHSWWVTPACRPIPEKYWDAWVEQFALVVIQEMEDILGPDAVWYLSYTNEPDTSFAGLGEWLGCWGETFEEGQYYAQFANHVIPQIRARYPHIRHVVGEFINYGLPFAEGVASTITEADVISFHSYSGCGWSTTGLVERKIAWFTENFPGFPLALSETGMTYDTPSDECDLQQAEYVKFVTSDIDVEAVGLYTGWPNGWKNTDLTRFDKDGKIELKPSYFVYESLQISKGWEPWR